MAWQDNLLWFGRGIRRPASFGFRDVENTKKRLPDQAEDRNGFFPNTHINRDSFATVHYKGIQF
jgi:hypothetical protein